MDGKTWRERRLCKDSANYADDDEVRKYQTMNEMNEKKGQENRKLKKSDKKNEKDILPEYHKGWQICPCMFARVRVCAQICSVAVVYVCVYLCLSQ